MPFCFLVQNFAEIGQSVDEESKDANEEGGDDVYREEEIRRTQTIQNLARKNALIWTGDIILC